MIGLGTTLRCNVAPRHLWVVLSDPTRTGGRIVVVSMTTLDDDCVDDVCVIGPQDYALLDHATTVAYSRHRIGDAGRLEWLVNDGSFGVVAPVSPQLLQKILAGARASKEMPAAAKHLLG